MKAILVTISTIIISHSFAAETSRVWTNLNGKQIEGTLKGKNATHADVLLNNGKRVKIEIKSLSERDQNYVSLAKLDAPNKPKKLPLSHFFDFKNTKMTVHLPAGDYTFPDDDASRGNILSDNGWICIRPHGKEGTQSDCKKLAESEIIRYLNTLTPSDKKEAEKKTKVVEAKFGDFHGFLTEGVFLKYGYFSNGKTVIEVSTSLKKDSGKFSISSIPDIIEGIEIH